ncbi:MAG: MFS transporter, partial [Gammaproteobacteria bacterium]
NPTSELIRNHWQAMLTGILITAATAGYNGLLFAQLPAYLSKLLHYSGHVAALAQNSALIAMTIGLLFSGWLGDKIPRRFIMRAGAGLILILTIPFYMALQAHQVNIFLLMILAGLCGGLINGTFASVVADLFPTRVRFSGIAIAYNISFTVFSGGAPLIATWLIAGTGSLIAPGYFMVFCAGLTFLASFPLKKLGGRIVAPPRDLSSAGV